MKNVRSTLTITLLLSLLSPSTFAAASLEQSTKTLALNPQLDLKVEERSFFDLPLEPDPVGIRIVIQAWNPLKPDEHHDQSLVEPRLVSDSLQGAWAIARERICTTLKTKMGVAGFAKGYTLSDIDCVLDQHVAFKLINKSQNVLHAAFVIGGYIAATSTTPDGIPKELDPRVSISLKANMELTVGIQSNPEETLKVSDAKFSLSEATVDSHGFTADVAKFVVDDLIPFFSGPNYKRIAEDTINSLSLDLSGSFNEALAPVNLKLKAPSDAIRVGLSFSSNLINVAFAPRGITPPNNGSMTGQLRWDPANFTPSNGCQSFEIRATVQVGPVPNFVVDAAAPTRQVGTFQIISIDSHTCSFKLTGLADGWPHVLTPQILGVTAAKSAGSSIQNRSYELVGDGWSGRTVVPQPIANNLNYIVSYSFGATAIKNPDLSSMEAQANARAEKVINPADTSAASQASLNPQPLPPGRHQVVANKREPSVGTQSGIIIVGGRHPNQPAPQQRPGSIDGTATTTREPGNRFNDLVSRGESLVNDDPAATELRNQFPEGPAQRGFNIGMAVAEGDTIPGPGKDSIRDSLPADQRDGFTAAVSYSLTKNRKQLTDLAPRGATIAAEVPLIRELRNQVDEAARTGFDIGLAVAEHDTQPGPGKQKIRDSLYPAERSGFSLAVDFSMERNRNIELAQIGAEIAQRDPYVTSARNAKADVFYKLGFDIATGLFGSPSMGAKGNTALGPGSMKIRDALNPRAQSGFNDSVKFHLGRRY